MSDTPRDTCLTFGPTGKTYADLVKWRDHIVTHLSFCREREKVNRWYAGIRNVYEKELIRVAVQMATIRAAQRKKELAAAA